MSAMHAKRTTPALGLPYRSADQTDIRHTWAAAASAQVPPLRACELCQHSQPTDTGMQCQCPAVRLVTGQQRPVQIVRAPGQPCGPGARHLHIASWSAA